MMRGAWTLESTFALVVVVMATLMVVFFMIGFEMGRLRGHDDTIKQIAEG